MMRPLAPLLLACIVATSACVTPNNDDVSSDKPVSVEKPFRAGGTIEMHLSGGGYEVRAAADDHVRLTTSGRTGDTKVDLTIDATKGILTVTGTPHSNFHAVIEVPLATDLVVRLAAGDLTIASIVGSKDVESAAGNVTISVGDPNDYATVDGAVKAGDIDAKPFGGSLSGLLQHFTWSGPGTHRVRASLGAGNLTFRSN